MVIRNLLDLMEPMTDTLERLSDETEVEELQICGTRYDVLTTVELTSEDKPGEAIRVVARNLREKVLREKVPRKTTEHPVRRQVAAKRFFLHNAGDAFIEFCEFEEPQEGSIALSRSVE